MELSYWEYKSWLSDIDFTIVGSGIVGLSTALSLKEKYPKANVLILEKGILPQGASTKNAGFACFGSISEVLSDLETHSEEEVAHLVAQRWKGIQVLRTLLGDKKIGFQTLGGHEIFLENDGQLYEKSLDNLSPINKLLAPIFGGEPFYTSENRFDFKHIKPNYITHRFEGQLDTGQMMLGLLDLVQGNGIRILNNCPIASFEEIGEGVIVQTNNFELKTRKLLLATNGFSQQILKEDVNPARAQVLITKPIDDLNIEGTFHFDQGYYYFRNIDKRILFGGGRNLDIETEKTTKFGQTALVNDELERLLKKVILPNTPFKVDRRWSGIMGVGRQKKPIIKQLSRNTYCGIRLGGMGVAIGTLVGKELADLV
ncbi:MAG: FAD-dependent oxidoreductase [Bacteroidota bacterium]